MSYLILILLVLAVVYYFAFPLYDEYQRLRNNEFITRDDDNE